MRRKVAIVSLAALALVSGLIGFILGVWWHVRSQHNHWDLSALRAKFNAAQVEGDSGNENPVFSYQVENTTDRDYSVRAVSDVHLFVKKKGALDSWPGSALVVDLPIFIPAHDKANVTVRLKAIEREQPSSSSTLDVTQFLSNKERIWNHHEAFVLFDHRYHYRLELPIGPWKTPNPVEQ
ncbi:MAG: hypothetical protein ACXU9L_05135 [Thermodesulfobacteriota bacterium]